MTTVTMHTSRSVESLAAEGWLAAFEAALGTQDAISAFFVSDSHWRDLVALTSDICSTSGAETIAAKIGEAAPAAGMTDLRIAAGRTAPRRIVRVGRDVIEAFFDFEVAAGRGTGVLRLVADDDAPTGFAAWTLLTTLQELAGVHDDAVDPTASLGFDRADTRRNWLERRADRQRFEERDPEVLVVGGGQSGLALAARLGKLGVDALVVDRYPRVGDTWRQRYHSLALHTRTAASHMPLMPFPETFPEYLPKDKLANWLEAFADAMDIAVWTSTEFIGGTYDRAEQNWDVAVRREDGTERRMRPAHVVVATGGVGGTPNIPRLPGVDDFAGPVVHTKQFTSGQDYVGQNVLVIGTGTSGHDAAFDLHNHGATVTMLQRSPTTVVSLESANLPFGQFIDGTPLDEADLIGAANFVMPVLIESLQIVTRRAQEIDKDLLLRLRAAGLRLDAGDDGTGYLLKSFRYGGGYYIDVGCSEAIAAGQIAVMQTADVDTFTRDGIRLRDGSECPLDAVVLATGYVNQQHEVRRFFGDEIAERVGTIFGIDSGGEVENAWKPTAQPGLWFMVGGLGQARTYSRYLALQLALALRD